MLNFCLFLLNGNEGNVLHESLVIRGGLVDNTFELGESPAFALFQNGSGGRIWFEIDRNLERGTGGTELVLIGFGVEI